MPVATCDIPEQSLLVRKEYLHDFEAGVGQYERCYWFGIHSWVGRALGCIVHTERGCVRDQLPISALCRKPHPEHIPLEHLQLWNAFSYCVTALEYAYLSHLRCEVMLKDGSAHKGEYVFTVDWYGSGPSENAGDEGRKAGHIVGLDCGCLAMVPNNRMLVRESSFATKPHKNFAEARAAGYRVNSREWRVERQDKWVTEDSGQFFYENQK